MYTYGFLLGRKNLLSSSELISRLNKNCEIVDITPLSLVINSKQALENPQNLLDTLGGTIKIIEIHSDSIKKYNSIPKSLEKLALKLFKGAEKKVKHAVSAHILSKESKKIIKNSIYRIKDACKQQEIKSRYINKTFENPHIAQIKDEKAKDLVALEGTDKYYYGQTIAIQNIDSYSKRDYKRPERDARLGMLPPKLAQIMINLSRKSSGTLYDPFCGIGTILAEGMLMNFNVVGSDLDHENIQKSLHNLKWLQTEYPVTAEKNFRLFQADAGKIAKKDLSEKIDCVISETYLGPPMSSGISMNEVKENLAKIEKTIFEFFRSIKNVTPKNVAIVLSLLTYRVKDQGEEKFITMTHLLTKLEQEGFVTEPLISHEISSEYGLNVRQHNGLLYERPDQTVCRTIFKFVKK
ncbi:hypothetical protein GF376_00500 [Candidatus Peregrinibacteria bacterium]|nr:hypothetical protein [Candidatus Peregrinibacteria bacterium]